MKIFFSTFLATSLFFCLILFSNSSVAANEKLILREEIREIVKEYLKEHPEVIIEALNQHRLNAIAERSSKSENALQENKDKVFHDPLTPSVGPKDAKVTVVEFFDYECGYCKKVIKDIRRLIKEEPDVRFVFKEFPILNDQSQEAARASLAVFKQAPEKYLEFHTALLEFRGHRRTKDIDRIAKSMDIDVKQMHEDMQSEEIANQISKTRELAIALNVRGTPGFIVNDTVRFGALPYKKLKQLIRDADKK